MRRHVHMAALGAYLAAAAPCALIYAGPRDAAALREQLEQIAGEMDSIQSRATAEGRNLTADEAATIESLYGRFNATDVALRIAEREATAEDPAPLAAVKPRGRQTEAGAMPRNSAGGLVRLADPGDGDLRAAVLPPGPNGRRYNDLFRAHAQRRTAADQLSPGEFLRNMAHGISHAGMIRASQSEGVGEAGGFEVPTQLVRAIFDGALAQEQVRPRCTIYPVTTNALAIPQVNAFDRSSNVAGVRSQWVGEGGTIDVQTGTLKMLTMRASKLVSLIKLSNELIDDSLSGGQIFADLQAGALAYDLDQAYLVGTGAGQPLGILNSPSIIVQDAESAQAADTILFANIAGMWARLHPQCQSNAVWFITSSLVPQLLQMPFDPAADSKTPIFTVGGTAASPTMTLMGRPVIVSEHLPALGDQGDILLVDCSKYVILVRLGMVLDRSVHAGFTTDESLWRLKFRTDGHALWPSAVTPRGGGPTLGWAVTLAAR